MRRKHIAAMLGWISPSSCGDLYPRLHCNSCRRKLGGILLAAIPVATFMTLIATIVW